MSKIIGPALPSHLINASDGREDKKHESDSDDDYGPALPPGYSPSNDVQETDESKCADEDCNEDIIGPLPTDATDSQPRKRKSGNSIAPDIEKPKVQREEWMTVVPEVLTKQFGMGPRKFDTTSSKSKLPVEAEPRSSRDLEQEKISNDLSAKRQESLLDIHRDKLKEESASGASKEVERVPFDREKDMKCTLLDGASKKKMIDNCQNFASRFQTSKSNKFL